MARKFGNEQRINRALGQEGKVRRDSGFYTVGEVAGVAVPAGGIGRAWKAGKEIKIGRNLRIAPFGNRTGRQFGRWPHYHRRVSILRPPTPCPVSYDPTTAQFLTRNPPVAVTQDPYSYAANDPINLTDPTGLYPGQGLVEK